MNVIHRGLAAACCAAACSLSQAATQQWAGTPLDWVWEGDERCRLQVTAVTQRAPMQALEVKVVNRSNVRVKYAFYVSAERAVGEYVLADGFSISNAAPGATSVGKTAAWKNTIVGARVRLALNTCTVIG